MKKPLVALCASIGLLAVAAPAAAAPSADTLVTFTVGTANLNISAPAAVDLGSVFAGDHIEGQIGPVTVTDERAALLATWVAEVTSTSFTTGAGTPEETIPNNAVTYWSGPLISSTGTGTFVPGQLTPAEAVTLNVPHVAFSKTSGSGNNSATWNPTLRIQVPFTAVGGLYQGTVTHSVA